MERLTIKKDDGRYYINQLSIDNSYSAGVNCLYGQPIDKLAEFEDFMEENGFEDLQDLKDTIHTWAIYRNETGIYYKEAEQEKQALKDRWNKLKEWVKDKMETCPTVEWYDWEEMWVEMQELEDRQ